MRLIVIQIIILIICFKIENKRNENPLGRILSSNNNNNNDKNLFENNLRLNENLFGNNNTNVYNNNPFQNNYNQEGLFGNLRNNNGLFGNINNQGNQRGLFGNNNQGELFGLLNNVKNNNKRGLFENETQRSVNEGLSSLNSSESSSIVRSNNNVNDSKQSDDLIKKMKVFLKNFAKNQKVLTLI